MRTLGQRLRYEKLELIASPVRKKQAGLKPLYAWVAQIKRNMTRFLVGTDEPQIWTGQTKHGHTVWYVRDARSHTVSQFASEEAVRAWLEERHWH